MRTFFTSDTHFFHKNLCSGCTTWEPERQHTCRPFDCPEKMSEYVAKIINSVVGPNDRLYHLGDWSFGGRDKIKQAREMINCKAIHLVYGNHDHNIMENDDYKKLFSSTQDVIRKTFSGVGFVLFHEPIGAWAGMGRGYIQLHGHCHGNYTKTLNRQLDVGVDTNAFKPYSLDEILDRFKDAKPSRVDHHDEKSNVK